MTQILAFAGTKQSGKTSGAHFVSAYVISQIARLNLDAPLFRTFHQGDDGKVLINAVFNNAEGEPVKDVGVINFSSKEENFIEYASEMIWPYVKIYSFADTLKEVAVNVFGIPYEQIYGTNAQKALPTHLEWRNLPPDIGCHREGYMSGRDFMQAFGSDICRKLYPDIWVDSCIAKIRADESDIAIIDDCRFINEINKVKQAGGKIIKLQREIDNDEHVSEKEIREAPLELFDLVLDNRTLSIRDKNQEILDYLYKIGWFTAHIDYREDE